MRNVFDRRLISSVGCCNHHASIDELRNRSPVRFVGSIVRRFGMVAVIACRNDSRSFWIASGSQSLQRYSPAIVDRDVPANCNRMRCLRVCAMVLPIARISPTRTLARSARTERSIAEGVECAMRKTLDAMERWIVLTEVTRRTVVS